MKDYKMYNFMLIGLLLLGSCKKALEIDPTTSYSSSNYWTETSQATAALYGAYNLLQGAMAPESVLYGEGRADNVALNPLALSSQTLNLLTNNLNSSLPITSWNGIYQVVNQSNLILKNTSEMKNKGLYLGKAADYSSVRGQAFAIRAFCYFYMTRIWGKLPLVTEPLTDANQNVSIARSDTTAVYARIQADLDSASLAAIPASYSTASATRAQFTLGAVNAIYTDFYMWRHQYQNALTASQKILSNSTYALTALYSASSTIDYNVNPALIDNTAYAQMFTKGFSTESIFEIDYNFSERATRSFLITVYGDLGFQPFFKASGYLSSKFTSTDLRSKVNFDTNSGIVKFFEKSGFVRGTQDDKNIIVYRLADIMLLRAEALNKTGDIAGAMTLVNQIRTRAGAVAYTPASYAGLTTDQIEDLILDERARELCYEGKRWYDLVRTGKALKVLGPINGISNPENFLWPINLTEIRLNPLLDQNSYYQ
ncbi:RagB/SusD family nutrient uptake outer membrane protein [Pedobacter sp. ISL-68]|uniref:RagB/SusD family nutrient uptake outer membrane protein n=1 Tax=unclassified Pedobacter TaxID=2628915 RepID=UPI001BEA7E7E|nr:MULTISPECIES: RagB/SusD family nutrient uptake outer membrane protein [unclassified Pedobacter]MBT2564325.1 RagB/SusD family nutrient uptake outer membrane protein [Pedobacter sp. ISL-64]MBT2593145.1 RagB/SusD family nutrient uptake outer membrane protein [Pedobacter sp. ISL-68]